jgi:hypothetical protein
MTEQEVQDFIQHHNWTFAKSMPKSPHYYVVKEKCRAPDEFIEFVKHIRKYGTPRPFFRKTYIYLDIGEWTYWTMGAPLSETIIINRASI